MFASSRWCFHFFSFAALFGGENFHFWWTYFSDRLVQPPTSFFWWFWRIFPWLQLRLVWEFVSFGILGWWIIWTGFVVTCQLASGGDFCGVGGEKSPFTKWADSVSQQFVIFVRWTVKKLHENFGVSYKVGPYDRYTWSYNPYKWP